jgi:hypothetical protein
MVMKMGMKRGVLAACGVVAGLAGAMRPADATLTSFTFGGFADGATVSVSFTGTDLNVDGVFSNVPGVGVAGEITGLTISFSGDSLIPVFVASSLSTDFVIYANVVGLTPTADGLPIATAGGGVVDVGGNNQPSSTLLGTFTLIGGACSAFGGNRVILPAGQCADLHAVCLRLADNGGAGDRADSRADQPRRVRHGLGRPCRDASPERLIRYPFGCVRRHTSISCVVSTAV